MLFNSLHFAIFFVIVLSLVAMLQRRVTPRNAVITFASYYFYGWWDWRFLSLLWLSTLADWGCGVILDVGDRPEGAPPPQRSRRDKWILIVNIVLNLTLLGFFKYYNFFADSAATLLRGLGLHPHFATLSVILPVGISFYTFHSISYIVDVYRGDLRAERSLLNYATYIAFFPQLVAGPIQRGTQMIPQFASPVHITWENLCRGFWLMGLGLVQKVVLADNAARVVDAVFNQSKPSGTAVLLGVYAFAIQIYCDFAGYSEMARGAAKCMGFNVMRNFEQPYVSSNPSEFWRRWHISLSSWLRDYLYIPLGGNRRSTARTYFNLMITMVLGGLWHGAAWTFVLWGAFHGTLLCLHRAMRPWMERVFTFRSPVAMRVWSLAKVVIFFHLICFSWLLFRADSVQQAWTMLSAVFSGAASVERLAGALRVACIACGLFLLIIELAQWHWNDPEVPFRWPVPVRATAYAVLILAFVLYGNYEGSQFIYFQF